MDRHLGWIAATLLTPAMFACTSNRTPTPPSPPVLPNVAIHIEGGPIYTGPLYAQVGGYIAPGAHHARLFPIDDGVVDHATDIALAGSRGLSGRVEVGRIKMFKGLDAYREGGCVGMCAKVPVIDYEAGETRSLIVDVMTGKVVKRTRSEGVQTAPGENEVRELFGTALADPAIASQVADDRYTVWSPDKVFAKPGTSCAGRSKPQHRCVLGVIFTPTTRIDVYVDLTDRTVVDWQSRDASA